LSFVAIEKVYVLDGREVVSYEHTIYTTTTTIPKIMSVLLFMPESGGNPMESIILTSNDEEDNGCGGDEKDNNVSSHYHLRPEIISRFDMENGKPVRRLSSDTVSSWSEDEEENRRGHIDTGVSTSGTRSIRPGQPSYTLTTDPRKVAPSRSRSADNVPSSSSSSSNRRWKGHARSASPILHREDHTDNPTVDVHSGILV